MTHARRGIWPLLVVCVGAWASCQASESVVSSSAGAAGAGVTGQPRAGAPAAGTGGQGGEAVAGSSTGGSPTAGSASGGSTSGSAGGGGTDPCAPDQPRWTCDPSLWTTPTILQPNPCDFVEIDVSRAAFPPLTWQSCGTGCQVVDMALAPAKRVYHSAGAFLGGGETYLKLTGGAVLQRDFPGLVKVEA